MSDRKRALIHFCPTCDKKIPQSSVRHYAIGVMPYHDESDEVERTVTHHKLVEMPDAEVIE